MYEAIVTLVCQEYTKVYRLEFDREEAFLEWKDMADAVNVEQLQAKNEDKLLP